MTRERSVVVVTGASAGVGRATAVAFARQGAIVALLARGRAGLEGAAKEVESAGGTPVIIPLDVTDVEAVDAAAQHMIDDHGHIDVWVNAAFTSMFADFADIQPDEFQRATDVTYMGFVNGTRAALRHMKQRNAGAVVQVGSALAYRGIPLQSAYCGAKHAIQGFTESVRCELLHDKSNVRITMVQLPAHNTPQFSWVLSRLPRKPQPVPPIFQPEVAARAIVHASLHYRREWYVTFSATRAIIANKIAPGLLDRYLGWKGVSSQQTDDTEDPNRKSNLFEPVDQEHDHGTHGAFDDRAHGKLDWQWHLSKHRILAWSGGLVTVAGGLANIVRVTRRSTKR